MARRRKEKPAPPTQEEILAREWAKLRYLPTRRIPESQRAVLNYTGAELATKLDGLSHDIAVPYQFAVPMESLVQEMADTLGVPKFDSLSWTFGVLVDSLFGIPTILPGLWTMHNAMRETNIMAKAVDRATLHSLGHDGFTYTGVDPQYVECRLPKVGSKPAMILRGVIQTLYPTHTQHRPRTAHLTQWGLLDGVRQFHHAEANARQHAAADQLRNWCEDSLKRLDESLTALSVLRLILHSGYLRTLVDTVPGLGGVLETFGLVDGGTLDQKFGAVQPDMNPVFKAIREYDPQWAMNWSRPDRGTCATLMATAVAYRKSQESEYALAEALQLGVSFHDYTGYAVDSL